MKRSCHLHCYCVYLLCRSGKLKREKFYMRINSKKSWWLRVNVETAVMGVRKCYASKH